MECARPLEDQTVTTHEALLGVFCGRTNTTFESDYQPPPEIPLRLGPT